MPEKKMMRCKNRIPRTNVKCNAELCETDGVSVFVKLATGDSLEITPRRSGDAYIVCPTCGGKTVWYRSETAR